MMRASTGSIRYTNEKGLVMSEQPREDREPTENVDDEPAVDSYGSLSVEDDPEGTQDPADLAGTANPDDAEGVGPSVSEADEE